MKNLVQKYKKVASMHDPYNYMRRKRAQVKRTVMEVVMVYTCNRTTLCVPFFSKVTFA